MDEVGVRYCAPRFAPSVASNAFDSMNSQFFIRRAVRTLVLFGMAAGLCARVARADTPQTSPNLVVNSLADTNDGVCGTSDCTLREAITAANAAGAGTAIIFASGLSGTLTLTSALPTITGTLSITGNSARATAIDGANSVRHFSVATTGALTLRAMTLQNGRAAGTSGTSVVVRNAAGGSVTVLYGGTAQKAGQLVAEGIHWKNNSALGAAAPANRPGNSGGGGQGGAVSLANSTTGTFTNCTFSSNTAVGNNGTDNTSGYAGSGGGGFGGAVYGGARARVTLRGCTFTNNNVRGGNGANNSGSDPANDFGGDAGVAVGGAVQTNGPTEIIATTIVGNGATSAPGTPGTGPTPGFLIPVTGRGLSTQSPIGGPANQATIASSLFVNAQSGDAGDDNIFGNGTFVSLGGNLADDATTPAVRYDPPTQSNAVALSAASDLTSNTNSKVSALADNGGAVPTMALGLGSSAIDAGLDVTQSPYSLLTDARGVSFPRKVGAGVDIGAFEASLPTLSINNVSQLEGNSGTKNFVFTVTLSSPATSPVSVNYATDGGNATPGTDYTPTSGTLTIPIGQSSGTVTVPVKGNTLFEDDKTFFLRLTNPINATIQGTPFGIGTILNDDPTPALISQFRLSGPGGILDEFVEVANVSGAPLSVDNWSLEAGNVYFALSGTIPANGHLLITNSGGYSLGVPGDVTYTGDIPTNATLTLQNAVYAIVDTVSDLSATAAPTSATAQYAYILRLESGAPSNTGTSATDWNLVDTAATGSTVDKTGVGP